MARLPQPGGDSGNWGTILNDYLGQAHNADGTIKTGAVTKASVGLGNVDNTSDATKAVASATKLTTPRAINGVAFDGSADITIVDSTKVPTTRTVNGKVLSANISLTPADIGAATAVQGAKADTAVQPADLGVKVIAILDDDPTTANAPGVYFVRPPA